MVTCPDCKGNGKCTRCKGTGKIGTFPMSPCPKCGGSGNCITCSGSFRISRGDKKIESKIEGTNAEDVILVIKAIGEMSETMDEALKISNSTIGILNFGELEDIKNISLNITTLSQKGEIKIAEAIKEIIENITENNDLTSTSRNELLDLLEELSKQAVLNPNQRSRKATIKAIITSIATGMGAAGGLAEVWSTWGRTISKFFGI